MEMRKRWTEKKNILISNSTLPKTKKSRKSLLENSQICSRAMKNAFRQKKTNSRWWNAIYLTTCSHYATIDSSSKEIDFYWTLRCTQIASGLFQSQFSFAPVQEHQGFMVIGATKWCFCFVLPGKANLTVESDKNGCITFAFENCTWKWR